MIIKEPKLLSDQKKYLIDFANLKQGLIFNQKNFINKDNLDVFFKKFYFGIPMLLPKKIKYFNYGISIKKKIFKIEKKTIAKKIFITRKMNYKPLKSFFLFGNEFCSDVSVKKKYENYVNQIINFNSILKKKITNLKKKGFIVGAFQTRNIPHIGHEKVINRLLKECDYVFINPVIGVKKKGDTKTEILENVYKYLIKKYYSNKVIFYPVYASMFYAGPREAIHHALIRQSLGFNKFIIGRDHAGSENIYNPNSAFYYAKKYSNKLKIKLIPIRGSFYCNKCKKAIILGEHKISCKKNLVGISGTDFRKCLLEKIFFQYARLDLQEYIFGLKKKLFY